jgi:hypothetical protein
MNVQLLPADNYTINSKKKQRSSPASGNENEKKSGGKPGF